MVLRLFSKMKKSTISYLFIVLGFILLAWCVYLFFKYKITVMEKETVPVNAITQLRTTR